MNTSAFHPWAGGRSAARSLCAMSVVGASCRYEMKIVGRTAFSFTGVRLAGRLTIVQVPWVEAAARTLTYPFENPGKPLTPRTPDRTMRGGRVEPDAKGWEQW
jgi:hypothetical protein